MMVMDFPFLQSPMCIVVWHNATKIHNVILRKFLSYDEMHSVRLENKTYYTIVYW